MRSEDPFAPVTDVAASLANSLNTGSSPRLAIDLFLNRVTLRHFRPSLPRSRSYGRSALRWAWAARSRRTASIWSRS